MANQPDLIPSVWAANNTSTETIPATTTVVGKASWDQGFPIETGMPLSQGGVPPRYGDFNGVLNALSQFAVYAQSGGQYAWSNQLDYSVGSLVLGTDGALYRAMQVSGPSTTVVNPVGDTSGKWEVVIDASKLSSALAEYQKINTQAWSNAVEYSPCAIVTGSDDNLYVALLASGPSTAAVNPVGDASGTWAKLANQPDVDALTAHGRTAFFHHEGSFTFELSNDSNMWYTGDYGSRSRVNGIQSACYDKTDHVIYALITKEVGSSQGTILAAYDADTKALLGTNYDINAVYNGCFFGAMSHQGFGVYHPTQNDSVRFFAGASNYASADVVAPDATKYNILNLVEWDYNNPNSYTIVKSWQITDGATYHLDVYPSISLSDDGTELVCYAKDTDNQYHFMVFDVATILAQPDNTVLQSYAKEIFHPLTYTDYSQGIFLDSRYFYCVGYALTYPHRIQVWDRFGEDVTISTTGTQIRQGRMLDRPQTCEGLRDFPDMTRAEAEGFVFMPRIKGGKNHLMLLVMPVRASTQRPPQFYDFESPARPAPDNVTYNIYANSEKPDLDTYITPGTYYFSNGGTHFPDGVTNGFLTVIRVGYVGDEGWSPIRQIFFRAGTQGSTAYQVYIRTANYKAANTVTADGAYSNAYYFQTPTYTWSEWDMFVTKEQGVQKDGFFLAGASESGYTAIGGGGFAANLGASAYFYGKDHSNKGLISLQSYNGSGYQFLQVDSQNNRVKINTNFLPHNSNTYSIGASNAEWAHIYAHTGTVETSDERLKSNIAAIPDAVLDAWGEVNWQQYKLKDSIAEKGVDTARLHTGMIAQRINEVFEAHGLDASRYGLFCYDKWDAVPEIIEDMGPTDEEGNIIDHFYVQTQAPIEAGDKYSIRYGEALCMEAAYQRRRADRAEARISALERRLNEMEAVLASLISPVGDETYAEPEQEQNAEQEGEE